MLKAGLILAGLLAVSAPVMAGGHPNAAEIVALDECDPVSFNAALGPNFCLNVALAALGQAVTLSDLFSQAAAGTPTPDGTSRRTR